MKNHKIKIETIYHNKVQSKKTGKEYDKFTLMYKGYGFSGFGSGDSYKVDDIVEIKYDENTKFIGKNGTIYFNLIEPKKSQSNTEVMKKLEDIQVTLGLIQNSIQAVNIKVSEKGKVEKAEEPESPVKKELGDQEIPVIEEDGTGPMPEDYPEGY